MLKIFFASHGPLADGMLGTLKIINGIPDNLTAFSAYMNEENIEDKIREFFSRVNEEDEVLLCSDLYGGSVNQIMYRYLGRTNTRLVTGINLCFMMSVINQKTISGGVLENLIDQSRKYLCEVVHSEKSSNKQEDLTDFFE